MWRRRHRPRTDASAVKPAPAGPAQSKTAEAGSHGRRGGAKVKRNRKGKGKRRTTGSEEHAPSRPATFFLGLGRVRRRTRALDANKDNYQGGILDILVGRLRAVAARPPGAGGGFSVTGSDAVARGRIQLVSGTTPTGRRALHAVLHAARHRDRGDRQGSGSSRGTVATFVLGGSAAEHRQW